MHNVLPSIINRQLIYRQKGVLTNFRDFRRRR